MKFILEIELGNDEMKTKRHIAEALQSVASKIKTNRMPLVEMSALIRDINGNRVGAFLVEE